LDGAWTLPEASCADCARITSQFESSVAKDMYRTLRTTENFPTRRKNNRPKYFEVIIEKMDGSKQEVKILASKYPTIYPILHLPPPSILNGAELNDMSPPGMKLSIIGNPSEINALEAEYPGTTITFSIKGIRWSDFFRVLAKVAHSLTVGCCGTAGYTPLLPPLILGKYPYLSNLVGGGIEITDPQIKNVSDNYELSVNSKGYIIANIGIMSGRCPMYTVVSGQITDWDVFMANESQASSSE
jgi:hypothetical protein